MLYPVNKATREVSDCYLYFLSNPCTSSMGQVAQTARRLSMGLYGMGSIPGVGGVEFFLLLRVQTGPGVHSTSYKMNTVPGNFSGGKGVGLATLLLHIILVTTLSSRGRGFTSSENRTNHSCSYNVAEYKSHCSSLLVRELKYYERPKKIL